MWISLTLRGYYPPLGRSVPLGILTVTEAGEVHVDKTAILTEREKTFALDTSKNFKLNAGTVGVCKLPYLCGGSTSFSQLH
jgi:hypothetical protein